MKNSSLITYAFIFLIVTAGATAAPLFEDDFESDLSAWIPGNGIIVDDILGHRALSFSMVDSSGDIFTNTGFVSSTGVFTLSFDYLGTCGTDDCGGFIGISRTSSTGGGFIKWIAATRDGGEFYEDNLPDTGLWTSLSFTFDITEFGEVPTQPIFLTLEDFSGSGPNAGDVFFDNISLVSGQDSDQDGIDDDEDNCLLVPNENQTDTDSDNIGNACDADFNNDCVVNFLDFVELSDNFLSASPLHDLNGDGTVNFLDVSIAPSYFLSMPGPSGVGPCRLTVGNYNFDDGFDDWTGAFAITYSPVGGNPDGFLRFDDPGQSMGAFVYAPSAILGDWSSFDQLGAIEFDHKIFEVESEFLPVRVRISGPGGTAEWSGVEPTGVTEWNRKVVPIREELFVQESGTWAETLENVTEVRIKISASSNNIDQTGIDNIFIYRDVP